uniref:C-type lectin domain-containing protein n=1 Tax=Oryzias latipes TaxID=8090 RepID=A0A3P9J9M1_ORYLA
MSEDIEGHQKRWAIRNPVLVTRGWQASLEECPHFNTMVRRPAGMEEGSGTDACTFCSSDQRVVPSTMCEGSTGAPSADMVVFQNQKENDHVVSLLPNRTGGPYYWIGITKNHLNETWKWIGNNSTWVGNHSWATKEPNNVHINEFCVEIYVNNGPNRGKWNDEKCSNKKFPVCYKGV